MHYRRRAASHRVFWLPADGTRLAFTATDPVSPAEAFLCHADGSGEQQLTDLNRAWKAEVALSSRRRLQYERAGYRLDCWVMSPMALRPANAIPPCSTSMVGRTCSTARHFSTSFRYTPVPGMWGFTPIRVAARVTARRSCGR